MCGLVGLMSSNFLLKHKEVLSCLLYLDTFRGRDSTGVAAIRHNADTLVLKATVPGHEFVEGPRLFDHLKMNDFVWIGHNRFGTVGKNIKSNAHPFMILDEGGACSVVGAHNGTLKNKYALADHNLFGTDSEALFNSIANEGLEETIPKIEGAWALTYYDHVQEELRILRNGERPLFYAWEEGHKTLIWASEIWMIKVACSRSDVKIDEDKIYQVNEDTLYRIPAPDKLNDVLVMHRKGGLVGKTTDFFQGTKWASNGGDGTKTTTPQTPQQKAAEAAQEVRGSPLVAPSSTTSQPKDGQKRQRQRLGTSGAPLRSNVVSIKHYKGFEGVALTLNELKDQLANGCGWCQKEFITITDKYAWLAPSKPVCEKCLKGEHEDTAMIAAIFGQVPVNSSIH